MSFEKGHRKVVGRKSGDANKITTEFRSLLRVFL